MFREGGAVDGQERPRRPAAVLVESARDQLLARAGGAGEKHGHVLVGHAANGLDHVLHGRAAGDDDVGALVHGFIDGDNGGDVHEPADGQRRFDDATHLTQLQRLEQIVVGAEFHGFDGVVGVAAAADEDDGTAGVDGPQLAQHFQPTQVRQVDVQHHHVGPAFACPFEAVGGRLGGQHFESFAAKRTPESVQDGRLVIDDQQRGHTRAPKKFSPPRRQERQEDNH